MKEDKLRDILSLNMENDDTNNIFNNYNNFTRDRFVFEETVKHCLFLVESLFKENERLQKCVNNLMKDRLEK